MKNRKDINTIEDHRQGFCISFNTEKNVLEVQRIDDTENWAAEFEYDFVIPKLKNDDEAKKLAEKAGYLFGSEKNFYEVTYKTSSKN